MRRPPALAADEDFGAWVPGRPVRRGSTGQGSLDGLCFAVKDVIDVAGSATGCGNPDRAAARLPAEADAPCVAALREAGAEVAGKTVTDEFAFSLEGENAHHGTPRNPLAPDRLPGGSSSGSVVAVAGGLVDFALGTDTGGSVRVPASFCGVYGFRPTHGAVSLAGVMPFAPSFDTVGWFAREPGLLQRVGQVLMPRMAPPSALRLLLARDVFDLVDQDTATVLHACASGLDPVAEVNAFDGGFEPWHAAYAALQGREIRDGIGRWIAAHRPRLGANIAPRFESLAAITADELARWTAWRVAQAGRLHDMLAGGAALLLPTTPGVALPLDAGAAARGSFYSRALAINALAGHAGLPQVNLPLLPLLSTGAAWPSAPLGLSIVGAAGSDASLLRLAEELVGGSFGFRGLDPAA